MFIADAGYAVGLLSVPILLSVLAAIVYSRRGWPHNYVVEGMVNVPGSPWRPRALIALSVLLGIFVFGATSAMVVNGAGTPSHSATYKWVIKMTRYGDVVGSDLTDLKKAETAHSLSGVYTACSNGAADVQALADQPKAPDARLETMFRSWLVDAFDMFSYCQTATTSVAQFESAAGTADWNSAMSYGRKADGEHARMVKYGSTLN